MFRFIAVCVVSAIYLSPTISSAVAPPAPRFEHFRSQCLLAEGHWDDGRGMCYLSPANKLQIKAGVRDKLRESCAQDGGKIVEKGGRLTCWIGKSKPA
jgi:hypothetical protein